jgi:DNA-binding NarL/FixJ family response regulator
MFKVLLVEDNLTYRGMLNQLLVERFPELQINEAGDGRQALLLSGSLDPDLVIMDIPLPERNGLDLTRLIKAEHPQTVVLVLSSYDLPEYRDTFERWGADYFVSKNVALESLFALVEGILSASEPH